MMTRPWFWTILLVLYPITGCMSTSHQLLDHGTDGRNAVLPRDNASSDAWKSVSALPAGTGIRVQLKEDRGVLEGRLVAATEDSIFVAVSTRRAAYIIGQEYGLSRNSIAKLALTDGTGKGSLIGAGLGFLVGIFAGRFFDEPGNTLSTVFSSGSVGPPEWLVLGPLGVLAGTAIGAIVDAQVRTVIYEAP